MALRVDARRSGRESEVEFAAASLHVERDTGQAPGDPANQFFLSETVRLRVRCARLVDCRLDF